MFVVIVVWVSIGMNLCWLFEFVFCLFGNCIEWVVLNMIGVFVLCMIVSECMFDMRLLQLNEMLCLYVMKWFFDRLVLCVVLCVLLIMFFMLCGVRNWFFLMLMGLFECVYVWMKLVWWYRNVGVCSMLMIDVICLILLIECMLVSIGRLSWCFILDRICRFLFILRL